MPKISIIIAAYNAERDIGKCINSIIEQKMQDYELIVVNDGSNDNTENIVLEYEKKLDGKLRYFYKENSGVADTRNFGLDKAEGDYILFVDADDYIDKNLLISQEENMNKCIDIIKFKMTKLDINGKELEKINGPVFNIMNGQNAFNELFYQDILIDQLCIYLFRRQYINEHNYRFIKGAYHEDFGLIPIMLVNAETVISTNIYGYYYIQSNNSIMRNSNHDKTIKKMKDSFMYYDNMIETINSINISDFTKENMKIYYTNSILLKIQELNIEDRKIFIKEFNKRNMRKNIKIRNLKQFIKRILLAVDVNLYFKIK